MAQDTVLVMKTGKRLQGRSARQRVGVGVMVTGTPFHPLYCDGFRPVPKVLEEDVPCPRTLPFPVIFIAQHGQTFLTSADTFRAQRSLGCFLLQPSSFPGRRPDWVHAWPWCLSFFISKLQVIASAVCLGHFHTHYLQLSTPWQESSSPT